MGMIPKLTMKRAVTFLLLGIVVFILYLYLLDRSAYINMEDIVQSLQSANLYLFSLAFVLAFLDTIFFSLAWKDFLHSLSIKVSFSKSLLYAWVGTFVDLLVPAEAVSGEISKIYLMSKDSGEGAGKVLASIIIHRILSLIITLSTLLITSTSFVLRYQLPTLVSNLIFIVTLFTAISLVLLCLLSMREQIALKMIDPILRLLAFIFRSRWRLTHLRNEAQNTINAFNQGIKIIGRHPKSLVKPIIFSITSWLFSLLISFQVFVSLGYLVPLNMIAIVHSISCTVQSVPLGIPGEVGLIEILMTTLYASLGVPIDISPTIAAAATVLIRVVNMWFRLIVGFIAFQFVGVKAFRGAPPSISSPSPTTS